MTHLSGFRGESAFTTWVFSIATNHLLNYKKHMFANAPLSFAIATHRINPQRLEYQALSTDGLQARDYMQAMEQVDDCSVVFSELPMYGVTQTTKEMLSGFLNSELCTYIKNA